MLGNLKFYNTGSFIMFSVITNIYNKKTKGPTLMELTVHHGLIYINYQLDTLTIIYS